MISVDPEVERDEDKETVEEAVKSLVVEAIVTISSATINTQIKMIITPQVNLFLMLTAPSETKVSHEKTAVVEAKEEIGAAQAEEDEVVNAGVEGVETREAELIIKETKP